MRLAMEYAHSFGLLVIDHCEDMSLAEGGVMNESYTSTILGFSTMPAAAEELIVARNIILSELTGIPIHLAHMSTKGSVRLIQDAKSRGVLITSEVTPHHLILEDTSVRSFDTNFKMNPPLRTLEDRNALIQALIEGTIDAIATDHAPHTLAEKELEFTAAPFGIIGLETAVPLIVDKFVHPGIMTWSQLAEKFSVNPAKILKVKGGTLKIGSTADITVINPGITKTVDIAKFYSKSKNSPFHNWELKGWPVYTIVDGKLVYDGLKNQVMRPT
jgi:dihydroorotase